MSKEYPSLSYSGFDISKQLISDAKANLSSIDAKLSVSDALSFKPKSNYDLIIASGVLSIFEDLSPLKLWSSWLSERGSLYIFGRFNSKDIDTIIRFRNHYQEEVDNTSWEGGLTSFSIKYVKEYLASIGLKSKFTRFNFPEKLPISDNPIRT
jgi:trans-aconitate methyltransferase